VIIQLTPEMKAAFAAYIAEVVERRHGSGKLDAATALSLSIMFREEAMDREAEFERNFAAAIHEVAAATDR
jgi:hypothetical protein